MNDVANVNAGEFNAAVQSAAKVAPTKGAAWDIASGIVLRARPGSPLEVRATDLDTTFQEWVKCHPEDTEFTLRVPSAVIAGLTANLDPLLELSIVNMNPGVRFTCGAFTAELNEILGDYPKAKGFDWRDVEEKLVEIDGFAEAIKKVAWGAGRRGEAPFDGIHFDANGISTTDKVSFVELAYDFGVEVADEGITVPLTAVSQIVPRDATTEIHVDSDLLRVRASFDGRMVMMSSGVYGQKFPNLDGVRKWANTPSNIELDREAFGAAVRRLRALVGTERYPRVKLTISDGELVMEIWHESTGHVADAVECDLTGESLELWMSPDRLIDACRAVTSSRMVIGHNNDERKPLAFRDPDDDKWLAVAMPMTAGAAVKQ